MYGGDHRFYRRSARDDLSGNLSLGSQEQLMETLSRFDEKRPGKPSPEQGADGARRRSRRGRAQTRALNGTVVEILLELENQTRLLILGHHDTHHGASAALGEHVEPLARRLERPVLVLR